MAARWLRAGVAWCAAGCVAVTATAATAAPPAVSDTIAQRVLACTACHGKEGRATNQGYFPRIAGKPAAYLQAQLINFRDGRRHHAAMTPLVEHLGDAYLAEIAAYFAALELPYPPAQTRDAPAAVLAAGRQLVLQGDASRGVPACTACHGAGLTGVITPAAAVASATLGPAVPGLLGLPRDYVIGQFGGWLTGQRQAAAPDCMAQIARRLSAEQVSAAATWLSSQPVPGGGKPGPAPPGPAPLACGSGLP
jgi:cytochrome c553